MGGFTEIRILNNVEYANLAQIELKTKQFLEDIEYGLDTTLMTETIKDLEMYVEKLHNARREYDLKRIKEL